MALETNDPADEGGAGVHCGGPGSYNRKAPPNQSKAGVTVQRIMAADLGPVWVLARPGCPSPGVEIERGATAKVRITSPVWGMGDGFAEFLNPDSPAVERYARKLGLMLRETALVEFGRLVRQRELAQREREAILASRNGGGR